MIKKLLSAAVIVGVIALPVLAFADSITPGVQTQGGTITGYSAATAGCDTSCAGAGATGITLELTINGTTVDSLSAGNGYSAGTVYTQTGLSIPFNSGDDIEITENYPYPHGAPGSQEVNGSFTPPPVMGAFAVIPTSTAPSLTADIGAQFSDPGTLLVIGLAAGIPLTFYVIDQLIGLLPDNRGKS